LRHIGSNLNPVSELYVTAQVWADSKPLTVTVQTPYKIFKGSRTWNEWLTLPIDYADIPLSAQLAITVWDLSPSGGNGAIGHSIPFGGTTILLFDKDNTLRNGRQRCHIHRFVAADGLSKSTTPSTLPSKRVSPQSKSQEEDKDASELQRLEELLKKHEMGELPRNEWLDNMVFQRISELERSLSKKLAEAANRASLEQLSSPASIGNSADNEGKTKEAGMDPGQFFLYIDFPRFDHPILFTDHEYPPPSISAMQSSSHDILLRPPPEVELGPGINDEDTEAGRLIRIYDPEVGMRTNPVEEKHRRLVRTQRSGALDRDLKPNAKIRDELQQIMGYGITEELTETDKDLVWKFRHHLTRNKRALTKFVKSTTWTDTNEARQAISLLPKWTEIDVDDALELLGPTFHNSAVRTYAVDRLRKADDEELLLYLLQLVQALKFEKRGQATDAGEDSSLARFLISRAVADMKLGNSLHWFLLVECDDQSAGQSPEHRKLFAKVEYDFMAALEQLPDGQARRKTLLRQGEMIAILSKISKDIRFSKEDRTRKIDRLKKLLADPKNELLTFSPPLPVPLDPDVQITGCFPEESNVFKSSLFPLKITFSTTTGAKYPVIFKTGDDLRQDQLVIQIILLMDRLLRKENLDLKLSPYRILATSTSAGAVQFVPSMTLAAIVSKHGTRDGVTPILAYLRANNPDKGAPLGVRKEAMDAYVKSCAGYCVITYLLGVGDRHLENLLLAPTGHFFHADFGYILGRDPKPFAPLMKLSREMVDGMGGTVQSPANTPIDLNNHDAHYYKQFKQHCFTAYTTLRKSSNLILNLFALMVDANIPDIRMEPERAVQKVRDRFHLELRTEEEVIRMWEGLMEDSLGSMVAGVIDWTHGLVQRFRA
jgi:phosphatidylinositol 3-kinase